MKLDCFLVWLHPKLLKGHAWFTQAKDEKTCLKTCKIFAPMKKKRKQNNKEFMAKKTKKQNWGVQNSQLPRNNQKINDMRGKKREWRAWN